MDFIAGLDGGGTKTVCLLASPGGQLLGEGRGGPGNVATAGVEGVRPALEESFLGAFARAGLVSSDRCLAVCAGLAGAGASGLGPEVEGVLREISGTPRALVTTDLHIALEGALGPGPGILVVAGTGSSALGRDGAGCLRQAGGFGPYLGDEGGAFWIVREAARACLAAKEGSGPPTALTAPAGESWPVLFARSRPGEVAARLPLVIEAARRGDAVARRILGEAGGALAGLAAGLARRLFPAGPPAGLPVAMGGSVLERVEAVREAFARGLAPAGLALAPPGRSPAEGALALARALAR